MPRAKSRTRFGLTIAASTPCATQLAMRGPLVAAGGLHHHQAAGCVAERCDQLADPGRIVADPQPPAAGRQVAIQPGLADVQADDLRLLLCSIPVPSLSAGLRHSTVRAHMDAGRDHADARAHTLGSFRSPTPRTHPLQGRVPPPCHRPTRQGSFRDAVAGSRPVRGDRRVVVGRRRGLRVRFPACRRFVRAFGERVLPELAQLLEAAADLAADAGPAGRGWR